MRRSGDKITLRHMHENDHDKRKKYVHSNLKNETIKISSPINFLRADKIRIKIWWWDTLPQRSA